VAGFLDQLVVSPLADGYTWYLIQTFRYDRDAASTIAVPERFETDFASIPFPLDALLPKWSNYGPAAVVHDWLYWDQPLSRGQADGVFNEAMVTLKVSWLKRNVLWLGVRLFGWWPWAENARLRRSGVSRLRPPGAGWPAMPTWQRFRLRSVGTWRPGQQRPAAPRTPSSP
jgi:hypothetical protein